MAKTSSGSLTVKRDTPSNTRLWTRKIYVACLLTDPDAGSRLPA